MRGEQNIRQWTPLNWDTFVPGDLAQLTGVDISSNLDYLVPYYDLIDTFWFHIYISKLGVIILIHSNSINTQFNINHISLTHGGISLCVTANCIVFCVCVCFEKAKCQKLSL